MGPAPLLRRFCSVGWSGILLKYRLLSAKVAKGLRKSNHHACRMSQRLTCWSIFTQIEENQRGLVGCENYGPNHHGLWILAVLNDSRRAGSLGAPAPVVLTGVAPAAPVVLTGAAPALVACTRQARQKMKLLELVRLELKLLFGYSADRF